MEEIAVYNGKETDAQQQQIKKFAHNNDWMYCGWIHIGIDLCLLGNMTLIVIDKAIFDSICFRCLKIADDIVDFQMNDLLEEMQKAKEETCKE